jgi:NADPH-dependent 2,4-dienoyl-CoA reductase/sulfur reductase-like enzyme
MRRVIKQCYIRWVLAGMLAYSHVPVAAEQSEKRDICILGGGPAGLSAAYYLEERGYLVTVFEKEDR